MEKVDSPASCALILICEKCGRKLEKKDDPSYVLQQGLRKRLKEEGRRREVRAVLSSCLDVCPKQAVAVAVVDLRSAGTTSFYEIAGKRIRRETDQVIDDLLANFSSNSKPHGPPR